MTNQTSKSDRPERPRYTGTTAYNDPKGRFEFRYPWDWIESDLEDDREGVIMRPVEDDEATYFAVWVNELEVEVVADDLPDLREGFEAGLRQLADCQVENVDDKNYYNIVKVERLITFTEDGVTRKRRVWALYADKLQFVVAYQGSTVEEYHYWLPMANYCFATFKLPEALWFATDPTIEKTPTA